MNWIFLSPHLDDSVLSAGGFIAERAKKGDQVEIWTLFAGGPPKGRLTPFARSLHKRWGTDRTAPSLRRMEDSQACRKLGAANRHFPFPDCIYRSDPETGRPLIQKEEDLHQPLDNSQLPVVEAVTRQLAAVLSENYQLVSPLAIGAHIDHQIVRNVAEQLNRPLWYTVDFPYVTHENIDFREWIDPHWQLLEEKISPESLAAWQAAIAEYHSQLSTFWKDEIEMRSSMEKYWRAGGGSKLWKRNP
jgi:LmbE family N-acetylglucosaminyl deacetylase